MSRTTSDPVGRVKVSSEIPAEAVEGAEAEIPYGFYPYWGIRVIRKFDLAPRYRVNSPLRPTRGDLLQPHHGGDRRYAPSLSEG